MNLSINFAKAVSSIIASAFITLFFSLARPFFEGYFPLNFVLGLVFSGLFSYLIVLLDANFRKMHLKLFNTLIVGLFLGILLGKCFASIFDTLLVMANIGSAITSLMVSLPKALLYLLGLHLGIVLTFAYSEEFHISIPFIRFNEVMQGKKDIILDETFLADPRAIDFLSTGIVNNRLILPLFMIKNLQERIDNPEDHIKAHAKKVFGVIEKLRTLKHLGLKEHQTDFTDLTDVRKKILRLAKLTKSDILVADTSKLILDDKEITYLGLNTITNSLKNVMSAGEHIQIKVQRFGKEPKQGVGYLEDGTMVVINNGGDFIGETIITRVISVKQTSAGRIIFTNALVDDSDNDDYLYESNAEYAHHHD